MELTLSTNEAVTLLGLLIDAELRHAHGERWGEPTHVLGDESLRDLRATRQQLLTQLDGQGLKATVS
jgi:hypothetical protein